MATPLREGASFEFPDPIGLVLMRGKPVGPGNAAFIWERHGVARFDGPGGSDSVPFEVKVLSSESRQPIDLNGQPCDVRFRLDAEKPSWGTYQLNLTSLEPAEDGSSGTFETTLELFFIAEFFRVGSDDQVFGFAGRVSLPSREPGRWSYEPRPGFVVGAGSSNFFHANTVFYGIEKAGGHLNAAISE